MHLFDLLAGYHLSFAVVEEGEAVPVSRLAPFNLPSKPMVLAVHMSALLGRLVFPHAGAFSGGGTWPGIFQPEIGRIGIAATAKSKP